MNPSNRLNLDYHRLAATLPVLRSSIIDVHSHIHGEHATPIYMRAAHDYGIGCTYTMTLLENVEQVLSSMGDRVRLIAVPDFLDANRRHSQGKGYIARLKRYKEYGATIAKFWNAPRIYEAADEPFIKNPFRLNSPLRADVMNVAVDLGMKFMTHVGDPDTWFATKYGDSRRYGTKAQQYDDLEEMLERFPVPWIAAHMGGYPEDLDFLSKLLSRHSNLYLDCSATKWIVRELSKHSPEALRAFFTTWKGRLLFGSDIVTTDAHVHPTSGAPLIGARADSAEEAYDLYASRYWALRTLLETDYDGESPISDPDLHLVAPDRYSPLDAPRLRGAKLPIDALESLYWGAAQTLLGT